MKEFFRGMAAIMFEQAILRELENNKQRREATQIGSDILREFYDIRKLTILDDKVLN